MAQTFYIEADEEIISVVARLRHTADTDIALIVPKHAILMQSIVSLKLLEREAKKIGKAVMIVSQDDNGRALAEKAGLQSRSYQDEQVLHEEEIQPKENAIHNTPEASFSPPKVSYGMKAESIGSESFFNQNHDDKQSIITKTSPKPESPEKKPSVFHVAIRDKSPKYQTALNSKQEIAPLKNTVQPTQAPRVFDVPTAQPTVEKKSFESFQPKKLFPSRQAAAPKTSSPAELPVALHSRMKIILSCVGIAVIFLISAAAFFLFTPKAIVTVFPEKKKEQSSFEFRLIHVDTNSSQAQEDSSTLEIPYRLAEEALDVPLSITPTGVGTSGERKARGKVIIYNTFGSESQSLVSTTRLEAPDGKIFRLTQGITIPGMTDIAGKKEPGAIEAEVIADQAGDDFNIAATTFAIPGFKGSPKYDAFSAKSLTPMTGGSKNNTSGDFLLTGSDIEQAKTQAKARAIELFRQKISESLLDGEKIDENGIELLSLSEEPILHEGLSGASIESTFHYKAKAFILSEKIIERAILRAQSVDGKLTTASGSPLFPKTVAINTIDLIPDFQSGGGKLKVTASILFTTEIKTDELQNELLGKHSDDLRGILDRHPEIAKMNLDINPKFFIKYIPKSKDRLTIIIADPEQN